MVDSWEVQVIVVFLALTELVNPFDSAHPDSDLTDVQSLVVRDCLMMVAVVVDPFD